MESRVTMNTDITSTNIHLGPGPSAGAGAGSRSVTLAPERARVALDSGASCPISRLCGRESSALLQAGGRVTLYGGHQPDFSADGRMMITRSGGKPLTALYHEELKQVCVGNSHSVFLTVSNKVYVTGSNQFGQLGVSPSELRQEDNIVMLDTSFLQGAEIRQVDSGIAGGTAVLTETGTVYTAGESNGREPPPKGQRGKDGFHPIPAEYFGGERVVFMSHGGCLSVYVTESGAVYITGYNCNNEATGMLGLGNDIDQKYRNEHTPVRIESLWTSGVRVVTACAGRLWAVVVDDQGRMFGWGCNRHGQLGLGTDVQDVHSPTHMPLSSSPTLGLSANEPEDERVVQVSCLWSHTLALTNLGRVFSFGQNATGQLGRVCAESFGEEDVGAARHSHAVPGLVDMSLVKSSLTPTFLPSSHEDQHLVVKSVHAGGWHTLLEVEANGKRFFASCGLARHGQLGGWDHLEEVVWAPNPSIVNLCRLLPVAIDEDGLGAGPEKVGGVVYVPAAASVSNKRRKGNHTGESSVVEDEEGSSSEDGDIDKSSDDESSDECHLSIDYSSIPISPANDLMTSFSDFGDRVLGHNDFPTNDSSTVHVCVANHYGPVDVMQLVEGLRNPVFLSIMKEKFTGLTFVSSTIVVTSPSHIEEFTDSLALYPRFSSLTLDLSSLYCVGSKNLENGTPDDLLIGQFCASLIRKISTLKHLSVEGLGKKGVALVCEACKWRSITEGRDSGELSLALDIRFGNFKLQGFQLLADVLKTTTILEALHLSEHEHISKDAVAVIADSLATNTSLHTLDMHVTEMGQRSVTQRGIEAIVTALEANPKSKLCKLDVSGDDGEPSIGRKLQRRLTKCLVRNSKDNFGRKYLRYAKLEVYQCHENE